MKAIILLSLAVTVAMLVSNANALCEPNGDCGQSSSANIIEALVGENRDLYKLIGELRLQTSDGPSEYNAPTHMQGDSFLDVESSHIFVDGATNLRIKNQGTQLVISGIATNDNPHVFCHGMPMGTLGLKDGKAIKAGNSFEELIPIPFYHQNHNPIELGAQDDPNNPYFETVKIYRLK